ncbi:uncharacterized protein LOC136096312 [Hydra vulgaris]|uniref:uncharacterized protein LOC136096312 n=1 Tax=Hydra vulgaris TaxID=6087 RepID=UPI0032EA80EC
MDNKKYKGIMLEIAKNLLDKDVESIKFYYSKQIGVSNCEKITTPITLIKVLEQRNLLGIDNYDDFVDLLKKIGRHDLGEFFSETSSSSETNTRLSAKKESIESLHSLKVVLKISLLFLVLSMIFGFLLNSKSGYCCFIFFFHFKSASLLFLYLMNL